MRVEKVAGYYSGVGDLFSALVLGHYYENSKSSNLEMSNTTSDAQNPLSQATIMALQKTYHVLLSTRSYVQSLPLTETEPNETDEEKDAKDPKRVVTRMKDRELRLIQEQEFLRSKDVNKEYASYMIPWEGFWE
jgi:pyridoxine kinase